MNQQSTFELPPLPVDTVEVQYSEETSPSEPISPKHVTPEYSPISTTTGPGATSTPETEQRTQNIPRRGLVTTPNNPSPLKQKFPRQERPVVKIKSKDHNLNLDGEEVEKFIKKVEIMAQITGATDEDLGMQMTFWTTDHKVDKAIEAIPGYEEGNWTQLKKDLRKNREELNLKEDKEKNHL
ncbi:hypothetical protein O181_066017 [Austropuccinia psidii MF-1]|uniref:Uncharacterized protein n=1 Tax=Austropuccinia psidii MF-1 TaxID=1389203 RepID=A0A9Q3I3V5_9BASI|nr:hypothetical protein [Austropuccinia psidii MF-1]